MKLTVFMPVYNSERYLQETIESILNQEYDDFEFLIINDGSTDHSEDIILQYSNDKRIRYIKNDGNKGLPYTRNLALELSRGEYIALIDADDISMPNRLRLQVDYLDKNQHIDAVGADYYHFEDNKCKRIRCITGSKRIQIHLMFLNCICNPVSMFRKSFIEKSNIKYRPECFVGQDYAFWVDVVKYGSIENISTPLLKYRFGHENITKKTIDKVTEKRKEVISSIRTRALLNNGFELSEKELDILNCTLYDGNNGVSKEQLKEIKIVLARIIQINNLKKVFKNKDFDYIIQEIWADIIAKSELSNIQKIKVYYGERFYRLNNRDIKKSLRLIKGIFM